MTTVLVTVEAQSVEAVLRLVETRLSPASLGSWLLGEVEPRIGKRAIDRFASEGDSASGRWAPLSDATISFRESAGYSGAHPINVRTGELENYITQGTGAVSTTPDSVTLTYPGDSPGGELQDKLTHAQKGGTGTSGKPYSARPVLAVDESDLRETELSLVEYIFGSRP